MLGLAKVLDELEFRRPIQPIAGREGLTFQVSQDSFPGGDQKQPVLANVGAKVSNQLQVLPLDLDGGALNAVANQALPFPATIARNTLEGSQWVDQHWNPSQ